MGKDVRDIAAALGDFVDQLKHQQGAAVALLDQLEHAPDANEKVTRRVGDLRSLLDSGAETVAHITEALQKLGELVPSLERREREWDARLDDHERRLTRVEHIVAQKPR